MVQGGLSLTTRRCGKASCACATDPAAKHGPHLYLKYREAGVGRSVYVPPEHAAAVEAAHTAGIQFGEAAAAIAAMNRAALEARWRHERPAATRRRRRSDD